MKSSTESNAKQKKVMVGLGAAITQLGLDRGPGRLRRRDFDFDAPATEAQLDELALWGIKALAKTPFAVADRVLHELEQRYPRPPAIPPRDPGADPRDAPRLTGQNAAILAHLQHGPATTTELATLSCKYTSRISDLRRAGYVITPERLPGGGSRYTLRIGERQ